MKVVTVKDKTQRQVLMLEESEATAISGLFSWLMDSSDKIWHEEQKNFFYNFMSCALKCRGFDHGFMNKKLTEEGDKLR